MSIYRTTAWLAMSCPAVAGLTVLAVCCGCSPGRLVESAQLGIDAATGTADPAAAAKVAGIRREATLAGQAGDLYLPADPRAALLLIPGVTPEGRDDPRQRTPEPVPRARAAIARWPGRRFELPSRELVQTSPLPRAPRERRRDVSQHIRRSAGRASARARHSTRRRAR